MRAMTIPRTSRRHVRLLAMALAGAALAASCGGAVAGGQTASTSATAVPTGIAGATSPDPGASAAATVTSSGSAAPRPPPATASSPQPVPRDLTPSLSKAKTDLPPIYADGCHLGFTASKPLPCAFGDTASSTRVVVIGDSNAAQWFPALERLAVARHWRLESLTKSACTIADIAVWQSSLGRTYTECAAWRSLVLARIKAEHPALVIAVTSRGYHLVLGGRQVPLAGHESTYQAALDRTLRTLRATAGHVVLLGATPDAHVDPPVCLAAHLADARACATPLAKATSASFSSMETAAAGSAGVRWVDPTSWVCTADPCMPIAGRILVYRDPGHLTATFAASLASRMGSALPAIR